MAEPIDRRELANYKDLLADYQPGLDAIATLERNGGDWAAGVDEQIGRASRRERV